MDFCCLCGVHRYLLPVKAESAEGRLSQGCFYAGVHYYKSELGAMQPSNCRPCPLSVASQEVSAVPSEFSASGISCSATGGRKGSVATRTAYSAILRSSRAGDSASHSTRPVTLASDGAP